MTSLDPHTITIMNVPTKFQTMSIKIARKINSKSSGHPGVIAMSYQKVKSSIRRTQSLQNLELHIQSVAFRNCLVANIVLPDVWITASWKNVLLPAKNTHGKQGNVPLPALKNSKIQNRLLDTCT